MNQKITFTSVKVNHSVHVKIRRLLHTGQLVQGPVVAKLELDLAAITGTQFVIAVNSGTAALHTALAALHLKPDAEVITSPLTFVATANAIIMAGATPVFADINPRTFNLDPQSVVAAITPRTRAILAVNLFGLPANYHALHQISQSHHLQLIEDAAQSIGATYNTYPSGSLADVGCFSLYATKNLFCGEGGFITTNSSRINRFARRFRHHGQDESRRYHYHHLGYNYRLTDLAATIAIEQLPLLAAQTRRRQAIALKYSQAFSQIPGLIPPFIPPHATHVYHQYTLRLTSAFPLTRSQLQAKLAQLGIPTIIFYPRLLTSFPHLSQNRRFPLPQARRVTHQALSLPIHPHLTNTQVQTIITAIHQLAHHPR